MLKNRKLSLQSARLMNGLKAKEVADMLGLNVGTLSEYENYRSVPRVDTAYKLAEIYGVKFDDIIFFKPNNV